MNYSKEKQRKNKFTKTKNSIAGITLIALVITVIVLLILAGVSIAMLTGNNGILTQAQNAKEVTENAATNETGILNDYETKINEALGIVQAEPGKYYKTNTEVQIGGKILTIPGGTSLSKIPGEYEKVDQGIVIYITNRQITDEEWQNVEAMQTTYDQFVWVPVIGEYERNTTFDEINISLQAGTDVTYLPNGIQPEKNDNESNENAEREAVTSKGGFYISRYEAGKDTTNKLISRKGATVWVDITQTSSKSESKKYTEDYNTSIDENVKSALCSGIQWDMTMKFVNGKKDGAENTIDVTINGDRGGSSPATSGHHPADKMCNIFDLEENYMEYVAEYNNTAGTDYYRISRGGNYRSKDPASYRYEQPGNTDSDISFRFVLYIQ